MHFFPSLISLPAEREKGRKEGRVWGQTWHKRLIARLAVLSLSFSFFLRVSPWDLSTFEACVYLHSSRPNLNALAPVCPRLKHNLGLEIFQNHDLASGPEFDVGILWFDAE